MPLSLYLSLTLALALCLSLPSGALPGEIRQVVEQLGMHQLIPGAKLPAADTYRGPVSMLLG